MTGQELDALMIRLERRLRLEDPEEEELLLMQEELESAEQEILLYLGETALDERLWGYVLELASLYYRKDCSELSGFNSYSYSEGQISERTEPISPQEFRGGIAEVLHDLSRYRKVPC